MFLTTNDLVVYSGSYEDGLTVPQLVSTCRVAQERNKETYLEIFPEVPRTSIPVLVTRPLGTINRNFSRQIKLASPLLRKVPHTLLILSPYALTLPPVVRIISHK